MLNNRVGIFSFCRWPLLLMLLAAIAVLSGCEDRIQPGEVARINGQGITLAQLEAMQNSAFLDWPTTSAKDQDALRRQYGPSLMDLLALELVKQQLEKKKLSVTDDEVLAEEALIRGDYPAGAFDTMLINESIDRETWRFLLKNRLSLQRFLTKVLRPDIAIVPDEATAYYRDHEADFVRLASAHFILISGSSKEMVERGKSKLAATGDPAQVQAEFPTLAVRTVRMDKKRLTFAFTTELERMKPGQLSPAIKVEEEFHVLLLLETTAERRLSPTEAYPLIEETLMEQKLNAAYNAWVVGRLTKSSIKVSRHLLPASTLRDEPEKKNAVSPGGNGTAAAVPAKGNSTNSDARPSD